MSRSKPSVQTTGAGESGPKTLKTSKLKKDEEVDSETKAKGAFSHRTMRLEREDRERALKAAEEKERKLQAGAEDTPKEEAKGKGKKGDGKVTKGKKGTKGGGKPPGKGDTNANKDKKCFHCDKVGHVKTECRKKTKDDADRKASGGSQQAGLAASEAATSTRSRRLRALAARPRA